MRFAALTLALIGWFSVCSSAQAEPVRIRMASLVPKNSVYHRALLEMGQIWQKAEGEGASFTVFTDGAQGGEADIVRRMRIGQLNAALLSVVGLRDIEPSVSALQSLPLMFRDWEELDYVREKLRPELEQAFLKKGYVALGWGDAGWVRFFSKEPASRPDDYKRMKMFAWAGEPEQMEIMKALGYRPVSLETADILPALQTGLISVVPVTPFYALAAQFNGPAPYMLELNWAPMVGALVMTKTAWETISPAGRDALKAAARKATDELRVKARSDVDASVAAMRQRGLQVTALTPELEVEWRKFADTIYPRIRGTVVPAETFDEVVRLLQAYRAGHRE
ncbi:TRAP transporter substrate-binding protein [Methylocaldum gracile]|jgi:TRAP-type C4-dicarboxylate transport system substrate-binding protein|uniref:TRAP transporter substrate-binding protein n=1 Tax=Methylocaldum sp. 0917 TaxID=2485163 RepID=UPI00105FF735